jgi:membrane fusion protein (multidrug efflux system)
MKIIFAIILSMAIMPAAQAKKADIKKVFTLKTKKEAVKQKIIYPAIVQSRVNSQVRSQFNAIVEKIMVPLGSKVKKGQNLLKLKNQDTTLSFKSFYLEAPVDGVVSLININKGSFVNRGEVAIVLTDPVDLFLSVEVPVKDLKKLSSVKKSNFKNEHVSKSLSAKLVGKGSVVNQTTGTVTCEYQIESSSDLLPGIMGKLELESETTPMYMLPESSLVYVGDETFVRKVEKEKIKKIKVEIGKKLNGKVIINSGLEEGIEVVERSNGFLADGDKVEVVKKQ